MAASAATRKRLSQYEAFVTAWDRLVVVTSAGGNATPAQIANARANVVETRNRLPQPISRLIDAANRQPVPTPPRSVLSKLRRTPSPTD